MPLTMVGIAGYRAKEISDRCLDTHPRDRYLRPHRSEEVEMEKSTRTWKTAREKAILYEHDSKLQFFSSRLDVDSPRGGVPSDVVGYPESLRGRLIQDQLLKTCRR